MKRGVETPRAFFFPAPPAEKRERSAIAPGAAVS